MLHRKGLMSPNQACPPRAIVIQPEKVAAAAAGMWVDSTEPTGLSIFFLPGVV